MDSILYNPADTNVGAGMVDLVAFAAEQGRAVTQQLPRDEQKRLGQFLTPPGIARFMAKRCVTGIQGEHIRLLEPAAGAGILAAAVVESILSMEDKPASLAVTLFELDDRLLPSLRSLAHHMRQAAKSAGVSLSVSIRCEDFLLSKEAVQQRPVADVLIANPPYFKLAAADQRAQAHAYAVHGQPNIYGLFMAASAALLATGGKWCFITPRSWTNGAYFSATRRHMLRNLTLDALHVFESRAEHFTDDEVLQEAMITWATAQADDTGRVVLSTSEGLNDLTSSRLHTKQVVDVISQGPERVITLRSDSDPLAEYTATLDTYGLKVSTGPVVAFRAADCLRETKAAGTVPLLWMQHVNHMRVSWPINKKREHIKATASCAWMLVPNATMVVMRRFSPKEDVRRVTAAAYAGGLPGSVLGLENHLNYIYRPGGKVSKAEARGLAAYLNSKLVDAHFRAVAGSTQVNARELRKLPLPALEQLVAIGRRCKDGMTLDAVDTAVEDCLGLNLSAEAAAC